METNSKRVSWDLSNLNSPFRTVLLAFLVVVLSYLSAKLGGVLIIRVPQTVWPLWPGCAVLVAILLLVPRKIWPVLLPAGLAGFVLSDLQAGVSIHDIAWLILADTVEILVAAWGVSYFLNGLPRLNSLKTLAKYSFFTVFLASLIVASIGIKGLSGDDWVNWRFSFLSEALAFLTVTPAILGLLRQGRPSLRASRAYYLEAATLIAALVSLSYFMFVAPERSAPPALLYSLVPFLIWSALRFGSAGVGTSATIVALMSIWGAVHGRGPFNDADPINRVLSLQLFLFCTSIPFMVLAVLVEERKNAQDGLRESEERLRLSMESGKAVGWEWDLKTGRDSWFGDLKTMFGIPSESFVGRPEDFYRYVHPEDRHQVSEAVADARKNHLPYAAEFRVVWPDGTVRWVAATGKFYYSASGLPERMLGMAQDITQRKLAEQALRQSEADLTEAQRLANVGSWHWDPQTDTVTWSEQLYRITGIDPALPAVSYKDHHTLYTAESWLRLRSAVEEALRSGTPYELDLEMNRSDGARRWIVAKGEARRDGSGRIVQLRGTAQDITDRKREQEDLRKSEERLRLAIQAGKMFACDWDAATDLFTHSPESAQILGIDPATPVTGHQVLGNIHPEDRERFTAVAAGLNPGKPDISISYRMVRPDGTVIWVERNSRAQFDEQGKLLRITGIVADITARKQAEEALRVSEERLRLAVQAGKMFAYEWDAATDRLVRSAESAQILGIDEATALIGQRILAGVHPDDRERLMAAIADLSPEKPSLTITYRMLRPDGTMIWLERNGRAHFDEQDKLLRIIGIVADVTERKRAEDAVRQSEEKYRRIVENTNEGIWLLDSKFHTSFVNRQMAEMLGYQPGEMIGRSVFNFYFPEDVERKRQVLARRQDGLSEHFDDRFRRRDGAELWVRMAAIPISKDNGEFDGALAMMSDITDRKRAEEALLESKEQLGSVVSSAMDAIIAVDDAQRILLFNASAEKMFGCPAADAMGRSIDSFIPERFRTKHRKHIRDFGQTGFTTRSMRPMTELWGLRSNGQEFPMEASISRVEHGGKMLFTVIIRDITDRKLAEEALQKSEEKFSKAFQRSPMALALTSAKDQRYIDVNESFERFSGWRREELIGRTPFDIGLWGDPHQREELVRHVQAEDSLRLFEARFRTRDGTFRTGLIGAELIELDGEPCVLAVGMDITEQKHAQEALRESEERFRLMANTAPMLIWMSDASKLCTYFNDSWLAFTGRPMELELGNGWAEGVHPEDFQTCLDTYIRAFDAREKFTMEYRLRRHDGEYRWILDIGVPRFNQDGSFAGFIGSCVDVSERKLAEDALSGVNRKLIEAQERERARIARELHDDVGQRLALLTVELEQLRQTLVDSPADLLQRVEELRSHSSDIASDVQSLSHELHSSKLEYLGIATAMRAFCHELSVQHNAEIVFVHDEIPRNLSQEISLCLFRVAQEALQNAVKHSGVRHFDVELRYAPDAIQLMVRDSGSGFDVAESTQTSGLGLISMAERLKLVDGQLSIDSQPHQGTTIRANVPLSKAAGASA
jgi:PAS domain S-box-containing protein